MTKQKCLLTRNNNMMGIGTLSRAQHASIEMYKNSYHRVLQSFYRTSLREHNHIPALRSNMADITYSSVDNEVSDILNKCFVTSFRNGYIKANDVVLPVYFKKFGQRIQDMDIRDDDIWVCSYPKTGFSLFKYPIRNVLYYYYI